MRVNERETTAEAGAPVIDTRSFAAGTAIRFALLLAFVVVDSLSLLSTTLSWWYSDVDGAWFEWCRLAVGYDPMQSYVPTEALTRSAFIEECDSAHGVVSLAGAANTETALLIAAIMAVFVLAATMYLLGPAWRRRSRRLLLVELDSSDELARRLQELVDTAELSTTPSFVIDPRADTVGAVVFGRMGRYTVCLDAGLVARGNADPAVLRDVVLHELAHIRNRDVDITYATVALWRAFLICAVMPNLVGQFVSLIDDPELWWNHWELAIRGVSRAVALIALTYLVRADILRTREVYADMDAARLAGRTAFAWRSDPPPRRPIVSAWQRFLGLWRTHPDWSDRHKVVSDPGILFGASAVPMFLTGVTAQVANVQSQIHFDDLPWTASLGGIDVLSTWTTSVLVVGVAGYILWRSVVYAVLTDRPVPSGWTAGIWLGAGMAVGELLSFRAAAAQLLPPDPEILLLFLISAPLFTWWVTQGAEIWIRGHRGRSIRPVQTIGLAAALIVFSTGYGYWMSGLFLLLKGPLRIPELAVPGAPEWFWILVVFDLAYRPSVLVGASMLWLFPLLAVVRRAVTRTPVWIERAHTGPSGTETAVYRDVSLWPAFVGAMLGGGLCWVAVATVMARLHVEQPPLHARTFEYLFRYPLWLSTALAIVIVLTALAVSATADRFRMMSAMAASGGAGLLGLGGLFVFAATDGCIEPLQVMAYSCDWRPRPGWMVTTLQVPFVLGLGIYLAALAALLGALVVGGGRGLFNRTRGTETQSESVPAPSRSAFGRRLAVVLVGAAVAGLIANTSVNYYGRAEVNAEPVGALGRDPGSTPLTIARRVDAWQRVGGADKANRLHDALEQLRTAVREALRAAEGRSSVPIDEEVFLPLCAAIVREADAAATFIPIPDNRAQSKWAGYLAIARRAGDDCRRSFDDNYSALFNRSMAEFTATDTAYMALLHRFEEIAGAVDR